MAARLVHTKRVTGAHSGSRPGVLVSDGRRALVSFQQILPDQVLELLSPPDRPVPAQLWVALAESEKSEREHGATGTPALGKRTRSCRDETSPSGAPRTHQRQRTGHATADTVNVADTNVARSTAFEREAVSRIACEPPSWSQSSQEVQNEGETATQSSGEHEPISQETPLFLDARFPRLVAPVVSQVRTLISLCNHMPALHMTAPLAMTNTTDGPIPAEQGKVAASH